jgi:hypothetical protein
MPKSGSSSNSKSPANKSSASSRPESTNEALPPLPSPVEDLPPLPPPPVSRMQPRAASPELALPPPPKLSTPPAANQGAGLSTPPGVRDRMVANKAAPANSPVTTSPPLLPPLPDEEALQLQSLSVPPDLPPLPAAGMIPPSNFEDRLVAKESPSATAREALVAAQGVAAEANATSTHDRDADSSQVSKIMSSSPQPRNAPLFQIAVPVDQSFPHSHTALQSSVRNSVNEELSAFSSPAATDSKQNGGHFRLISPELNSPISSRSLAAASSSEAFGIFSGSVSCALQKFKAEQSDLVQVLSPLGIQIFGLHLFLSFTDHQGQGRRLVAAGCDSECSCFQRAIFNQRAESHQA